MRWFAVLSFVLVAGCSAEVPTDEEGATSQDEAELKKWCKVDGKKIPVGTSVKVDCNTCVCMKGGGLACTKMACLSTCSYGGNTYNEGDSFPATDGCNTCSCGPEGTVACTRIACSTTCNYGGNTYKTGDSFPSTDGCNTCSCSEGGVVACTEKACAPKCDPATEFNRKYVGTPEQCMLIRFVCETGTSYFSNECGCGCEQPADCPEWINCMPGPKVSTCSADRARCPFSQVAY
jgi:hypothetical protein